MVDVLERPRLVTSVPHWRGAQVRLMAGMPDVVLKAAPVFWEQGLRNLRKARAQAAASSRR